MRSGRSRATVAVATGGALVLGQVGVAELTGILTLGADFGNGDARIQGVQPTLVAWFCAITVPLAVTIVDPIRPGLGAPGRRAAALARLLATRDRAGPAADAEPAAR